MMFDYAIVGMGAAGAQLALAMSEDNFFKHKRILIIEQSKTITNDKRWSFWQKGTGKFDPIVKHKWDKGEFYGPSAKHIELNLNPYTYKSIHSSDFFEHSNSQLKKHPSFQLAHDEVHDINQTADYCEIKCNQNSYQAKVCFDSRINEPEHSALKKYVLLWQHFKGWHIKCDKDSFDPNRFVMMDFRYRHPSDTSFIYVLPYSKREALIEFTAFTSELYEKDSLYEDAILKYLEDHRIDHYDIVQTEHGKIPMSDYPFHHSSSDKIIKIGTAGSWVRPSTGYSFHYISKYVAKLIASIKANTHTTIQLLDPKTRWLDSVLLEVLDKENELGPAIFADMYQKNKVQQIFSFLDGETNLLEDLKIIQSFEKAPFIKAALRHYFR